METTLAPQDTEASERSLRRLIQSNVARLAHVMVVNCAVQTATAAKSAKPGSDSIQYLRRAKHVLVTVQVVQKMCPPVIPVCPDITSAKLTEAVCHARTRIVSRALLT